MKVDLIESRQVQILKKKVFTFPRYFNIGMFTLCIVFLSKTISAKAESGSFELVKHNNIQGTINTLPYERIEGRGVRFRYTKISENVIGHFWYLDQNYDLRARTIQIHYSGIVPAKISIFLFHSFTGAKAIYHFRLDNSLETKTISFQVPNTLPFKAVSTFELKIEKREAQKSYGDFLIEKVEILPEKVVLQPFQSKQSHPFPFGGYFLQSNIWGGEVRAS